MRGMFIAGDRGEPLLCTCFPDSSLKTVIDAAMAAGTSLAKYFVQWSTGANFEVATLAENGVIQGRIVDIEKYVTTAGVHTYILTVEWFWYVDRNSAKYPATRITVLPYEGSAPALGTTVACYSTTYKSVKDYTTLGAGRVIGVDTTNTIVAVMQ